MKRWRSRYGEAMARDIAAANAREPALDLTVKSEPQQWAATARRPRAADRHGAPARSRAGAEACRASMAAAGGCRTPPPPCRRGCSATCAAKPSPIFAPRRAARPRNWPRPARTSPPSTARCRGSPGCARTWRGSACRPNVVRRRRHAVGGRAVRRHPARRAMPRRPARSAGIPTFPGSRARPISSSSSALQTRLLDRAAALLKPGGTLVYCTCSLEPEEGEQADRGAAGAQRRSAARDRSWPRRSAGWPNVLTPEGDLRTLPCHLPDPDPRMAGLDGFYAARIVRN